MQPTALFLILNDYADWESAYLSSAIQDITEGKLQVKTVSISQQPIKTLGGFTTLPDYSVETAPKDFEGLFLIGGESWKNDSAKEVLPLVQFAYNQNRILGGICAASEFLATNGFSNHVKHTSNGLESLLNQKNSAYNNAKNYVNKQAVRDGNIITANGTATLEFCKECSKALAIATDEVLENEYIYEKIGFCEMERIQEHQKR